MFFESIKEWKDAGKPLNSFICGDCMEGMLEFPDRYFDLAIPDPPYGLRESSKNHKSRNTPVLQKNGTLLKIADPIYKTKYWDNNPPDNSYFKELFRISKHQIIWGINHFKLPDCYKSKGRLVWDKINGDNDFSDCELAYVSLHDSVRLFRYRWQGMIQGLCINKDIQQGNKKLNEQRIHPTQKAIKVYKFIIQKYAKPGWKIVDTHVGSASSLIACEIEGYDYIGFEIDREYFDMARDRMKRELGQFRLGLAV